MALRHTLTTRGEGNGQGERTGRTHGGGRIEPPHGELVSATRWTTTLDDKGHRGEMAIYPGAPVSGGPQDKDRGKVSSSLEFELEFEFERGRGGGRSHPGAYIVSSR